MNDHEIDALQIVLNNEVILFSLRKVFEGELATALPNINGEANDVIGQKYRAYNTSKQIIEDAFIKLESLKKTSTTPQIDTRHI